MAGGGGHECPAELRCTTDKTGVDEEVVMFVEVVVRTGFDSSTGIPDGLGALVLLIVVEAIHTPVVGIRERAVEECHELILIPFEGGKSALLHYVPRVVAIHDVAYCILLICPCRVIAVAVVLFQHTIYSRSIDEVITAHQIADNRGMNTLVVTHIDTGGEVKSLVKELIVIGADQSVPVVVIAVLRNNQLRPVLARCIDVFYRTIVECAILAAEGGAHHAIVCAACKVGIGVFRIGTGLPCVAEASTNRGVERSRERGFIINLPNVIQRNLRLVIFVVVRTFLLTIVPISVGRVVAAIIHAVFHVFLHVVPLCQRQCAA